MRQKEVVENVSSEQNGDEGLVAKPPSSILTGFDRELNDDWE
jgi:hypothetical protein